MPVVEVPCPGCGAKLKAPDTMAGKKAKCKKCGKGFRVPGTKVGDSASESQALSVMAMPAPPLPDDDVTEVMMAEAVDALETTLPLPANPPAPLPGKDVSSLPSADAYDFSKPAPKPAFGSAKAAPAPAPVAKSQATPGAPAPAKPAPAKPAPAKPAPAPAPVAKGKAAPEPLPLDDDDFQPVEQPAAKPQAASKAKAPPAPEPAPQEADNPFAGNPFAFSSEPEKPAKSKKRERDDDEDEKPSKSKRRDEEEEKPAKSKRRDNDEDEEDDEKPRKKRKNDDEDEDEPPAKSKKEKAAPADDGGAFNPFSNFDSGPAEEPEKEEKPTKSKRKDDEDDKDDKPRKKRKGDEDEPEEQEKPRYRRPEEQDGAGKTILIVAALAVFAIGLAAVAAVVYIKNNKKEPEPVKKDEKKDETPVTPPAPLNPPEPPPPKPKDKIPPDPKPKDKDPEPKPKDPDPKPKDPDPTPPTRPTTVALPKLRPLTVGMVADKADTGDKPRAGAVLETPLAAVRRVFPPFDPKSGDTYVLVQTSAGIGGRGEKLGLDTYGPAGNRVAAARIEYDGDGSANPLADLHTSATGVRFLAASGGKLHVWSVADKVKLADSVNPYADKPDHAKAGMAAAFFSAADPNQVVTVSTAGAVLLYDLTTKQVVSEFIPPNAAPNKVSLGLSVAKADGNGSIVLAVAGVLYQVTAAPGLERQREYDLKGDVGRSLGIAASGTPGRLLYTFETAPDKTGKKEKAILVLPLGNTAKHQLFPIPATVGEPKGALWSAGVAGGVVTDKGVLWFDDEDGQIVPMCFTQPAGPGLYFGDEKYFWYVIAHPKDATKSVLIALSGEFNDRSDLVKNYGANQPLRALKIDANGMSK